MKQTKLTKLLEYQNAGNSERKQLANKHSFKTIVLGDLDRDQKELLLSDEMESSKLLQSEVYDTIIEGQKPYRSVRDVIPTFKADAHQVRVTYTSGATAYADEIPEGGKIPIDNSKFETKNIDIKKIGTRPLITNEMVEDGLWDMVQWELRRAGARMENKLNRDVIDTLCEGSWNSEVTANTVTLSDIASARKAVFENNWIPTEAFIYPTVESHLVSGSNLLYANRAGDSNALRDGEIGKLFGLNFHRLSVDGASSTHKWGNGYDGANEVGVLVFDPEVYGMIAMRRELEIEEYDDPIHDLMGLSATMRFGSSVIQGDAGCIIEYS